MADTAEFIARVQTVGVEVAIDEFLQLREASQALDDSEATVELTARDYAEPVIESTAAAVAGFDNSEATASLNVTADTSAVGDANDVIATFDGSTATAHVAVEADTSGVEQGADAAAAAVEQVPEKKDTKFGADTEEGERSISGLMTTISGLDVALKATAITGTKGFGKIAAAASGGAAAVGVAMTAMKRSLDEYVTLATSMDRNARAVGIGVEEYSRLAAAVDNVGISTSQLNVAIIGMNRGIKSGGDALARYGIAATDTNGELRATEDVFLDVIGVIDSATSAEQQAAIATDIMGRGYKAIAPIIGESEEAVRGWMDGVSDAQVITAQEAESAREMQIAQDALSDSLWDVKLALGEMLLSLAPLITQGAEWVDTIMRTLGPLTDFAAGIIDSKLAMREAIPSLDEMREGLEGLPGPFGEVSGAIRGFIQGEEEVDGAVEQTTRGLTEQAEALLDEGTRAAEAALQLVRLGYSEEEVQAAMEAAGVSAVDLATDRRKLAAETQEVQEIQNTLNEMLAEEIRLAEEAAAAELERADAMRAQADSTFALTDAQVDFNDQLAGYAEAMTEAGGDALKMQQVNDDLAESAGSVADSFVQVARDAATAAGTQLTAAQEADAWNRVMLEQAAAAGDAGGAIIDYIARVNGIPPAAVTEIKANVAEGDLAAAEAQLVALSANRSARVEADLLTEQAKADAAALAGEVGKGATMPVTVEAKTKKGSKNPLRDLEGVLAGSAVTVPVEADTAPAQTQIAAVGAAAPPVTVPVDANPSEADAALDAIAKGDYSALVNITADDALALLVIASVTDKKRTTTITAVAETGAADDKLDGVAAARRAPIDAYLRDYPSAREIEAAVGVARIPVDTTVRSSPRITGLRA